MRKFTKLLIVGFALLICQIAIQAQTSGTIIGTVNDPKGDVVPGANVMIKKADTGEERTATTNEKGVFTANQVPPGMYIVTVETKGFKKAVATNVKVDVSGVASLAINLEIGGATETVTVTGAQEVINTSNPSLTNVVNTRQVVDLPLNGRNPVDLAALQAGIAVVGNDTRGSSVSGLRQTAVNLTQDGINAMDNFVKTSSFFALTTPSLNSTSEFSVTTGTVGADAGRGAAQVNLVTKGGTNQFHGGAFLQLINSWTNSNLFFNNYNGSPKPILRQHYDGFDIGGPVYFPSFKPGGPRIWSGKDKAFFFFSYERFVQSDSASRNRVVLTQSARNGNFQYTAAGATQTVNLLNLTTVPFHTLNPFLTAHLALIPLPNNFTCASSDGFNIGCFTFNAAQLTSNDKYVVRYDHQIVSGGRAGSHKIEFNYSRVITKTFPDVTTNGLEAPFPGGVNGFQGSTRNLITPALISTFGSNITNTFRYGRQFAPVTFDRESQPTAPFISLPGVLTNYDNTFLPQPRNTIVNQITDTLAWVKGNHILRFGMDFQNVLGISRNDAGIIQLNQLGTNAGNGNGITLASLPGGTNTNVTNAGTTYNAIVGLLSSAALTLNVTSPTSGFVPGATRLRKVQEKDLALFAQDQWRIKNNLTLTYGVRWDYNGVPYVPNELAIQPKYSDLYGISGFGNLFKPTATPGGQTQAFATQQFVSGKTGIPLYKKDWNNFAPSVGFAWQPSFKSGVGRLLFGEEGKSAFRGGYSVSYLHDGITTFTNLLGTGTTNPGLIQTANQSIKDNSSNITGQLTSAGVPLITPTFRIPITDRDNFLINSGNGLWTVDPNLKTAYVHQYSFGFQREIMKDTSFEIRYSGNRSPNNWRAQDINEVNIFENGFLSEFKNAQINLAARGGTSFAPNSAASPCAACVALPIFDKFFGVAAGAPTIVAAASGYGSSTFISNLNNNNVGTLASTLSFNSAYRLNRESTALGLASNFFVANPNATFARVLINDSKSNYNAVEVEVQRRFSRGLQFQANYTYSKAMGDAVDAQGNNQSDLVNRLTLRNPKLDYRRSGQDQRQRFVTNTVYELPFGKGKDFFSSANGVVNRIIGGWSIGGIATWSTGVPFYVASGRATVTSSATNNGAVLSGISFADFKSNVGLYKDPRGVFFINPNLLNITVNAAGKATGSTLKTGLLTAPAPGTFGNFPVNSLDGPKYFDFDFSVTKRIPITERVRFEIKSTFINVLNHPNFIYGTQNFDATTFGLITTQRGTVRQMNFIGQLRF